MVSHNPSPNPTEATHIWFGTQTASPADYCSHKSFYSVILQGVVDHRLRFWDINVAWPGKVHDATVFSKLSSYEKFWSGTLLPNITDEFAGVDVPVLTLGDVAYSTTTRWTPLFIHKMCTHYDNFVGPTVILKTCVLICVVAAAQ